MIYWIFYLNDVFKISTFYIIENVFNSSINENKGCFCYYNDGKNMHVEKNV